MEAGNAFLPAFMERFNERFAVVPAKPENLHRKVNLTTPRLTDILCHREQRYLSAQLSFHYDRRQIILERSTTSEELAGKYVDLYDYTDGKLEVRWKGVSLPYRVFAKDKRVTQTAIVENKRLGHALSLVKAQQELKRDTKVLTNSEKGGYKKRPRSVYGPDFIENALAPKTVEIRPDGKRGKHKAVPLSSHSPWKSLRDFTHSHRTTTMRYKRQIRFAHPTTL